MAAVFPLDTSQPWTNNGVTYEYDASEDRWYVVSTNATDQVANDIADLNEELDALEVTVADSSTQFLTTTGGTINADGGLQSSSGNLVIQDKAAGGAGRLYVKDKDGNTNLSVFPSGALETKSTISLAGPTTNKNLRCYGSEGSTLKILTGDTASSLGERMSVSSTSVTVNTNLIGNNTITGTNILATGALRAGTNFEVETTSLFKGKSTFKAENLNDFTAGVELDTINNTTTLWNRPQPGVFQFKTNDTIGGGTAGVFINGASNSPAFTVAIGTPGYSLDRVFSCSYSSTYGKRIYVYPNWGQGYANAANLPDQTPATLGYLRAQGLVTTASTTAASSPVDPSGVEHGDISFQTDVTVPSQMTLSADLSGGTGFTLKGKTVADPNNHNAELFKTTHYTTADEALVEYFGDVHSSTSAIQTKASVATKVSELQVKIRTAVDDSTDYATLKAALLAAL